MTISRGATWRACWQVAQRDALTRDDRYDDAHLVQYRAGQLLGLAAANHLPRRWLLRHLSAQPCAATVVTTVTLSRERLAAAARQPPSRIARLFWPDGRDFGRGPQLATLAVRPACGRCMAARGLRDPVPCRAGRASTSGSAAATSC
jgi:protein-disulfide isomerase-like protein with CxxC motif